MVNLTQAGKKPQLSQVGRKSEHSIEGVAQFLQFLMVSLGSGDENIKSYRITFL